MTAIVCYAKCWACTAGQHYDPPAMHSWMDIDDIEHAKLPIPRNSAERVTFDREHPCGCHCCPAVKP